MNNFEKIYLNIINQQIDQIDQADERILDFYMSNKCEFINKKIEKSFNQKLQEYKIKYPNIFDNIILTFDLNPINYQDENKDYYASLTFNNQIPIIQINVYSITAIIYYKTLNKKGIQFKNSANQILNKLLNWYHNKNYTVAHQLAHILDLKTRQYLKIKSVQELHDNNFDKCFFELTNKHLSQTQADIDYATI